MALSKKQQAEMNERMREALLEISRDSSAFNTMNGHTRNAMINRGLLQDDGTITHIGREFMANSNLDIHTYDALPEERVKPVVKTVAVAASNGAYGRAVKHKALKDMRSRLLGIIREGSEGAVAALVDEVAVLNQLIEDGE